MGLFTIGNLITLGIVITVLAVYRKLDRQSRGLDKMHRFAGKLKEDLASYVAEKEGAVRDFSVALEVQQKSAKELMKRLQLTDEELSIKAAALAKIDERIGAYDSSLEELIHMTGIVQENMERIRAESGFVENVLKQVNSAREKFNSLERNLEDLESRFQHENNAALENIAAALTERVTLSVKDFEETASKLERRVEDTKEILETVEKSRAVQIERDAKLINTTLEDALRKAVDRADTLEDSTVIALREQSQKRLEELHTTIEERLSGYKEQAKNKIAEIQSLIANQQEAWRQDNEAFEVEQHSFYTTVRTDMEGFASATAAQQEAWERSNLEITEKYRAMQTDLEKHSEDIAKRIAALLQDTEARLLKAKADADASVADSELRLSKTASDAERRILEITDERLEQWHELREEADTAAQTLLADLDASIVEVKTQFTNEIAATKQKFQGIEERIMQTVRDTDVKAQEEAQNRFTQWQKNLNDEDEKFNQHKNALEAALTQSNEQNTNALNRIEALLEAARSSTDAGIIALEAKVVQIAEAVQVDVLKQAEERLEQWKAAMQDQHEGGQRLLETMQNEASHIQERVMGEIMGVEQRIDELNIRVNESGERMQADLENITHTAEAHITEEIERLEELLKATEAGTDAGISALEAKVVQIAEAVQVDVLKQAEEQLEQWKAAMQDQHEEGQRLLETMQVEASHIQERVMGEIMGVEQRIDELSIRVNESGERMQADLENITHTAEAHITEEIERLEELLKAAEAGTDAGISALEAKVVQIAEAVQGDTVKHAEEQLEQWKAALQDQHERAQQLLEQIAGIKETVQVECDRLEELVSAKTAGIESDITQRLDEQSEQWQKRLGEKDEAMQELYTAFDSQLSAAELRSQEVQTVLTVLASDTEQRLQAAAEETKQTIQNCAQERIAQWTVLADEADTETKNIVAELETTAHDLKERFASETDSLNQQLSGLQERVAQEIQNIESNVQEDAEARIEQWNQTIQEEDERIRLMLTDLEEAFNRTKNTVSEHIAESESQLKTVHHSITEIAGNLEDTLKGFVESAEHEVRSTLDAEREQWMQKASQVNTECQTLLNEFEAAFERNQAVMTETVVQAENKVRELEAQTLDIPEHLGEKITQVINEAESRITTDTESRLAQWNAAIQASDVAHRALLAEMEVSSTEIKARFIAETAGAEMRLKELQDSADEVAALTEQALANVVSDAEEKVREVADGRLEYWNRINAEADAKTRTLLSELEASSAEIKRHFTTENEAISRQLDDLEARSTATIAGLDKRIDQIIRDTELKVREDAEQRVAQWEQDLKAGSERTQFLLTDLKESFAHTKDQITDEIDRAEKRLQSVQQNIEESALSIENTMTGFINEAEQKAHGIADAALGDQARIIAQSAESHRALLSELLSDFEQSQTNIAQTIAGSQSKLEELQTHTADLIAELEKRVAQAAADTEVRVREEAEQKLVEWQNTFAAQEAVEQRKLLDLQAVFDETKNNLLAEKEATERMLHELAARMAETTAGIEETLAQSMAVAQENIVQEADARLDDWKAAFAASDETQQARIAELESLIKNTEEELKSRIVKAQEDFTQTLEHMQETTAGISEEAAQKAKALADSQREQWVSETEQAHAQARQLLVDWDASFVAAQSRMTGEIVETENRMRDISARTDEARASLENTMAQIAHAAQSKILQEVDSKLREWKQAITEGDLSNRALLSNLEESFEHTKEHIAAEIDRAEKRLQLIQQSIAGTASTIEETMTGIVSSAGEKAQTIADAEWEKWQSNAQQVHKEAQELLHDWEDSFSRTKQQVDQEISTTELRVNAMKDSLSQATHEIEAHILHEVDDRLQEWNATIQLNDSANRAFLAELEASFKNTDDSINGRIRSAEERLTKIDQHIIETTNTIHEVISDAISNAGNLAQTQAQTERERWQTAVRQAEEKNHSLLVEWETARDYAQKRLSEEIIGIERTVRDIESKILQEAEARRSTLLTALQSSDTKGQVILAKLETSFKNTEESIKDRIAYAEDRLNSIQQHLATVSSGIEQTLSSIIRETSQKAQAQAQAEREKWQAQLQHTEEAARALLADWESSYSSAEKHLQYETSQMEHRLKETEEQILHETVLVTTHVNKALQDNKENMQQALEGLIKQLSDTEQHIDDEITAAKKRFDDLHTFINTELAQMEPRLYQKIAEMEQQAIEEADLKFAEYRLAQLQQFQNLERLADDTSSLESELRQSMQETEQRIRHDFSLFERDSANARDTVAAEWTASANAFAADMDRIAKELSALKVQAYQTVSEKLDLFEEEFAQDISRRSKEIEKQFEQWQQMVETKLTQVDAEMAAQRRAIELACNDDLQMRLAGQNDYLESELEKLRGTLETIRSSAEETVQDALTQQSASLDTLFNQHKQAIEEQMGKTQTGIEAWQSTITNQVLGITSALEEARHISGELIAENDERISAARSAIAGMYEELAAHKTEVDQVLQGVDRQIKEFTSQTQIFDKTDQIHQDIDRHIMELNQRREEIADLEGQFAGIKHLEEEVNSKMTRFLSEKHRIEQIENDFNRLLQTARSVEEKLVHVNASDDILQAMQVQIRKLQDALQETEERYQRIEKKNETLEHTNDGIDRNFKSLQELEQAAQGIRENLQTFTQDFSELQKALETLDNKYRQVQETTDSMSILSESLEHVEERIRNIQVAREWLARTETRMEELNRQAQDQVKLFAKLVKPDAEKPAGTESDHTGLAGNARDTIIKLDGQGWSIDEIARTVRCSKGEVELILELARQNTR
jgi:DNA repair exonuclease SbcCD ATPase subunit